MTSANDASHGVPQDQFIEVYLTFLDKLRKELGSHLENVYVLTPVRPIELHHSILSCSILFLFRFHVHVVLADWVELNWKTDWKTAARLIVRLAT